MAEHSKIIQLKARASSFQKSKVWEKFYLLLDRKVTSTLTLLYLKTAKHLSSTIGIIVLHHMSKSISLVVVS